MSFPLVSIIIVNYNGKKYLERCLSSVLSTEYPNFEIIFVDNASTDESLILLDQFKRYPKIEIIKNTKNTGFAEGNNIGIRASRGEYVVFLNTDTEVTPNWLIELIKVMEEETSIGAGQSKLLQMNDKGLIDSVGDFVDLFGAGYSRGNREKDVGQYSAIKDTFSARGAAMITRRSVIREVGSFDSDYFIRGEDIDLCWRMLLRGYRIVLIPTSVVYHVGGGSTSNRLFAIFHGNKNLVSSSIKNYSLINVLRYNPMPIILGSVLVDLLPRRNPKNAFAKLKAIAWVLRNLRRIWRKRLFVQRYVRKQSDSDVIKLMLKTSYKNYLRSLSQSVKTI